MALTNFQGGCMWNFQGVLRHFQGGLKKFLVGGRGLRFLQEGLRIFHKGLGFFGKGLRFSSSVWDCFSDSYAIFGEREFFRERFKFFGGVEMLSEVFGIMSGGVGIIFRGVEFVQGIWKISGGGGIFSGWLISVFMCMGKLKLSKGG